MAPVLRKYLAGGRPAPPQPLPEVSALIAEAAGRVGETSAAASTARRRSLFRALTRRRVLLAIAAVALVAAGGAYTQRDAFTAQGADLSRRLIGDERTARVESWYFRLQDRVDRTKYRIFGGETNPFATDDIVVEWVPRGPGRIVHIDRSVPFQPVYALDPGDLIDQPMKPPATRALRDHLEPGEGAWTTSGLPRSTATDMLMAKTFIHPDPSRPYASVGVLLIDQRRARLHIVGGTDDPGGDRGVHGPGAIAADDLALLLAAWNGGFKGPHGGFGMVADGQEYRPLRNGLATICTGENGRIVMGTWGSTLAWSDTFTACRQNAVLLVENGEVSTRVGEGNDTWGYVQVDSTEFITWRSAVGLTADGNLLFAAGNSLSAESLAKALWAAGAETAMQLDINSPYVLASTFFAQPGSSTTPAKFMESMPDSASRFFKTQERDFMYVTYDDSRYRR